MIKLHLDLFPKTDDNMDANEITQYYVDKYDKQGYLDRYDQIKMHEQMRQIAINYKKKNI